MFFARYTSQADYVTNELWLWQKPDWLWIKKWLCESAVDYGRIMTDNSKLFYLLRVPAFSSFQRDSRLFFTFFFDRSWCNLYFPLFFLSPLSWCSSRSRRYANITRSNYKNNMFHGAHTAFFPHIRCLFSARFSDFKILFQDFPLLFQCWLSLLDLIFDHFQKWRFAFPVHRFSKFAFPDSLFQTRFSIRFWFISAFLPASANLSEFCRPKPTHFQFILFNISKALEWSDTEKSQTSIIFFSSQDLRKKVLFSKNYFSRS